MGSRFHYDAVSGHLLGRLTIKNLWYREQGLTIAIDSASTETSINFFPFRIACDNLHINKMIVGLKPQLLYSSPNMSFPTNLLIKHVYISDIHFVLNTIHHYHIPNLVGYINLRPQETHLYFSKEFTNQGFLNFKTSKKENRLQLQLPISSTHLSLNFIQNNSALLLDGLLNDAHEGSIKLHGKGENLSSCHLELGANQFHLEDIHQDWPGLINFTIKANKQNDLIHVALEKLKGNFHQQPIFGEGALFINKNFIKDFNLNLISNHSKFAVRTQGKQLNWVANISEIKYFLPSSKGSFFSQGITNFGLMQSLLSKASF